MELFQILQKDIPEKKKIFALFHKQEQQDISKYILKMIKHVKKETNEIRLLNMFCIELYDILYYHLMFGNIRIIKKLLRLIEALALPMRYTDNIKRGETLKKTCKIKIK